MASKAESTNPSDLPPGAFDAELPPYFLQETSDCWLVRSDEEMMLTSFQPFWVICDIKSLRTV